MSELQQITIKKEYLELVPRLSETDRNRLKESLQKDGQLVAIIVNQDGIILDGHTRYELCTELVIKPIKYKVMSFKNSDSEMRFVIMTNLARRQLNNFQKVELAWPLYEIEKKRALEREQWKTNQDLCITDKKTGKIIKAKKPIKEGLSAMLFGKKIGVGKTLIARIEWLKNNASPELLKQLRNGESIGKAYDLLRGLELIPKTRKPPEKPIQFCPVCNTKTTSAKKIKCHVHRWFCCTHCRWGV